MMRELPAAPSLARLSVAGAANVGRDTQTPAHVGRVWVLVYIVWLSTYLVEGPLRGALAVIGAPNVLYLRDLVIVLGVTAAFIMPPLRGERHAPGLVLLGWLLAVHVCIGLLLSGTIFQRLFGVKVFLPLLFTVAIFPAVQQHARWFVGAMALFFVVSVTGVFVNAAVGQMPWEGMSYDTAFGSVETTRQWWVSGGVSRLPGFARASFDAAMIIGLSGVVLMAVLRWRLLRLAVAGLGGVAIYLTTSKGMIAAFAVATLWLAFASRSSASLRAGRILVLVLLALTCLVPAIFLIVHVPEYPTDVPLLLSSLWDRFSWMWPSAYALLPDGFGALTGVGPGGVGTAISDGPVPNSADSIFVYYFVTFGLLGIGYLAFPARALFARRAVHDPLSFVWAGLLVITYGYGLSINMVEQAFFTGVFGLLYGKAFAVWAARKEAA